MPWEDILYEKEGNLAIITINRPHIMNAFTGLTIKEMIEALEDAARDSKVRSVILTGAGDRAFSAGAEVGHLQRVARGEESRISPHQQAGGSGDDFCRKLYYLEKPTFAAINGVVAAGSLGFILACDIRIASDKARIAPVFIQRSITSDFGTSWHLPRILGESRALEFLFSGKILSAEEALKLGLVSYAVPHESLLEYTKKYAISIGKGPPLAMALAKREVRRAFSNTLEMQMEYEGFNNHLCHQTEDFKEAVQAFQEKREPMFTGR